MSLDDDACYRALQAHDARFDGLFFVGVHTTGIYCRCVCTARTPKRENISFYESPAAAEKDGLRPCLICRPETAPGRSRLEATRRLASTAWRLIEEGALDEQSVDELAAQLGTSARHLRRSMVEEFGVSPVELAQTQRLLSAKRLLTDTQLSVGEVAFAAGFASLRRFNALFQERYRLSPREMRRRIKKAPEGQLALEIGFREPYFWPELLRFFQARSICGVETVGEGFYARTARVGKKIGLLRVELSPKRAALFVTISSELASELPTIIRRLRRQFDANAEPLAIQAALGDLAKDAPGLRLPGAFDGFELAVRAILGQQVSVQGARTVAGRFAARFGDPIDTGIEELQYVFPTPERMLEAQSSDISELGVIRRRAESIRAVAQALVDKRLRLTPSADPESTRSALLAIPGIGEWTADYILVRALGYPDAFPASDLGLLKALGTTSPKEAIAAVERYRPFRAYAAQRLWTQGDPQ